MSRLIVKNLPDKLKEEKLREIFTSAGGEITDLKLCFTRKGVFRKFGFVGYKTEEEAQRTLNMLNQTFIKTSKILVEVCNDFGDNEAPRAWSKYAKESSANMRKGKEIQERKDRIKQLQQSKLPAEGTKKNKKLKEKRTLKELEDVEGDEGFQEFLAVHSKSKQTWTDQTLVPDTAKEVVKEKDIISTEKVCVIHLSIFNNKHLLIITYLNYYFGICFKKLIEMVDTFYTLLFRTSKRHAFF